MTTVAGVAGILVTVLAASLIGSGNRVGSKGNFWAEMATVSEGTEDRTGSDRQDLWRAGFKVFKLYPILGAAPNNFGVVAAARFRPGDVGGQYQWNPLKLYDRQLHNIYAQVLSEFGALGSLAYLWLLYDFWRRNSRLRSRGFRERWRQLCGGAVDLRLVALGLESGMVGYLATGFFYNQLFNQWGYTFYGMTCVLYAIARPRPPRSSALQPLRPQAA